LQGILAPAIDQTVISITVRASAPTNSDYQVVVCYATPQNLQPMSLAGIQSVLYGPGVLPTA
jgi:hypothetical protein